MVTRKQRKAQYRVFGVYLGPAGAAIVWAILAGILVLGVRYLYEQSEQREADCAAQGGVLVKGRYEMVCVAPPQGGHP